MTPIATTEWTVTASVRLPPSCGAESLSFHRRVGSSLNGILEGRQPVYRVSGSELGITFGLEGNSLDEARLEADRLIALAVDALGLAGQTTGNLQAIVNDAQLDDEIARLPACVGVGEAASILGVSKQRVAQLAQKAEFPAPAFRLKATPVWREDDVRRYASSRSTAPGRPAGRAS